MKHNDPFELYDPIRKSERLHNGALITANWNYLRMVVSHLDRCSFYNAIIHRWYYTGKSWERNKGDI